MVIDSLLFVDDIFCELYNAHSPHLQRLRVEFRDLAKDMLKPMWRRIGGFGKGNNADEKDTEVTILRPLLLSALVRFDDANVIHEGYEILEAVLHARGGAFQLDADGYIDCFADIDQDILQQLMEAALSSRSHGHDEEMFAQLL